jgi:GWxTD domain-containing protein
MNRRRWTWFFGFFLALLMLVPGALAQQEGEDLSEGLPRREIGEKERKRREERLRKELETHFKKWLDVDVDYIITPEEREAFKHLNTDEEREQFVEQFWLRRDPTPDTIENESKEEHYRRIAYANERFASGKPGWKTDRGRIYIMHGPADEVESYPAGGTYQRTPEEGGGSTSVYPFERWRYRYLEGVGTDIIIEFVDPSGSGEYRMTMDPSEKDALLHVPGAGLSMMEQLGMSSKVDRFTRTDGTRSPQTQFGSSRTQPFERLSLFAAVQKPPPVKFKDLESLVNTRISFNLLPFEVRLDYLRVTETTTLVPVTIGLKNRDLTFQMEDELHRSVVNVFGRITTLTGRIVQTFEDVISLDVPPSLLEQTLAEKAVYQKAVPLRPGLYKLNLVLKDLNSGNVGTLERRLAVPLFEEEQLAHSTLILADRIERVPSRNVGRGQFVIGDIKVRPAVDEQFTQQDRMGIYMQVYNLGIDETTHKPDATIQYSISRGSEVLFDHQEQTGDIEGAGQQITLEKVLPLSSFAPGEYKLQITINDKVSQQTLQPSIEFRVNRSESSNLPGEANLR